MIWLTYFHLRARASSAAPTWFSGYYHEATGTTYLDGGLYNNNPINVLDQERKLVWPNSQVDITVSIGTGYDPYEKPKKTTPEAPNTTNKFKDRVLGFVDWVSPVIRLATIACDHVENSLNSQKTWEEYQQRSKTKKELLFRLNTALQGPIPELHEVDKIPVLIEEALTFWAFPKNKEKLRDLAQKLVASSFYFTSTSGPTSTDEGKFCVLGN
jgi:predicted acylesterase/phospholipase RssA